MNICKCGCGKTVVKKWSIGHNRKGVPPTNKIGFTNIVGGYVGIYTPNHPRANKSGYVREHHLVVEKNIGRYLKHDEVVHHINHNRSDNRLKNLQLMTKKEHDRETVLVSENCKFEGCKRKHRARGLCGSHYGKYYRRKIEMPLKPTRKSRWDNK